MQLGMCFGNENVMYEKRLEFNFNQTVYYRLGDVIHPKDFPDENAFVQRAKHRFAEFFEECYQMIPPGGLDLKKSQ